MRDIAMKKILSTAILASFVIAEFVAVAYSQGNNNPGSSSGGSSAITATSTLTTLAPGSQSPQGSLAGATYVQPAFGTASGGGTQVDATHGLPINCITGCSGAGTGANNADAVAAVSTGLGQNTAYPFLWDGVDFDRWYGDTTNGGWVNVKNSVLPTGAATAANQATIISAVQGPVPACAASPCVTVIGDTVIYQGTTALSATNGLYSNLLQGNAVISATNGLYNNLLQGNAVISATNGIYTNLLQGNAVIASGNPLFNQLTAGSANVGGFELLDSAGTNKLTIKPASTAPVATDTSAVFALNPTSPGIVTLGGATPANSVPTVPAGYTYAHITTDATTVVKSGAGVLHTICVNTLAATSTITIDDATSATTPTIGVIGGGTAACYTYDVAFSVGLTIVTATAAPDITVAYR